MMFQQLLANKHLEVASFEVLLREVWVWSPTKQRKKNPGITQARGSLGRSLSRFQKHEAIRNISIPPGWDASPSQGYPQR